MSIAPFSSSDYVLNNIPSDISKKILAKYPVINSQMDQFVFNDLYKESGFIGSNLKKEVSGNNLVLTWEAANTNKTTLPILAYAHSKFELNGQTLSPEEFSKSYIGAIQLQPQLGKNTLVVSYQPSKWFSIGVIISIVFTIFEIIIWLIAKVISKLRKLRIKSSPVNN